MTKTNLQQRFQKKAKYLNQVLRELGREERIRKPKKLNTLYIQSLEALGKRKLEAFFEGDLPKLEFNKIAKRLTGYEPLTFSHKKVSSTKQTQDESNIKLYEPFEEPIPQDFEPEPLSPQLQKQLDTQEFRDNYEDRHLNIDQEGITRDKEPHKIDAYFSEDLLAIIDVSTGEILEDLHDTGMESIDEIHPSHRKQYFEQYFSKYNITNIDDLTEETYYSYLDATHDRIDEVINLDTKGAEIFRSMVNGWYSAYGEENTLRAINSLEGEFWETVDRVSEYPESGEVGTAEEGKELGLNIQKLNHLVADALLNTQFIVDA